MEWNLKSPSGSWDFTEFTNLDNVNSSTSTTLARDEFSVDLKLGRVGNSGNEIAKTAATSSPSGSSKRSRGSYNGSQAVSCLVDGCNADLSACRDYHRRHKVCELHSKTSQVTIGGHKQRFCQQCSRFHALEEFDEGKRSCRKRLDGHNRRRRKPQPEPFSRYGTLLSNYQGSQLLPFSSSLVYPSTAVVNQSWGSVVVKTEPDSGLQNSLFLNSGSQSTTTKPFALFHGQASPELSQCHHHHNHNHNHNHNHSLLRAFPVAETGKLALYEEKSTPMQVQNSECALSLLSSPQTPEIALGQQHNNNNNTDMSDQLGSIPLVELSGLEQMGSALVTCSNGSELHCPSPGMFHHHHLLGSDQTSSNNDDSHHHHHHHHQTLPSHWG